MTATSQPLADSPWLWAALFTGVGLAALLATGGKFGNRQASIERKYQARAALESGTEVEAADADEKSTPEAPKFSTPDQLVIPLWPLMVMLAARFLCSLAMLLRERLGSPAS